MRICVIGAGAIGGFVGARMAFAGHEVTLIARGAHLRAIRERGLTLVEADGTERIARVAHATDDISSLGLHPKQDLVIVALKAHQMEPVLADIKRLCHADTIIVPMQNGIPFWYFHKHGGALAETRVHAVDPQGVCLDGIPAERIIGCVVYPACELVAPGVVRHIEGDRFPLGELDGSISNRVKDLSDIFAKSGLKAPVLENIRNEIWLKLWGNLTFNPISALSHATLQDICRFPLGRELATNMMREAQAVAEKLGVSFRVTMEKRIDGAEKVGRHKTSMLQDVEAGRAIEIDALVGSVVELGQLTGVPTPTISAIYQASKLLAHTIQNEKVAVRGIEIPQV